MEKLRQGNLQRHTSSSEPLVDRANPVNDSEKSNQRSFTGTPSGRRRLDHAGDDGDVSIPPALIGTCPDMCPVKERSERERIRDLAVFERLNGNPRKTSSILAVKKFCRTLSTECVCPSDIRPFPVLEKTLDYLFSLLESSEHPFEVIHGFVFDRTRSIRQDICMQRIVNDKSIYMYEQMVTFHVESHRKLANFCRDSDLSLSFLNLEQLKKCLLTLFDMYDINRKTNTTSKNDAEYYSLYILLHLSQISDTKGDSLSSWFRNLPLSVLRAKEMQLARNLLRYFRMGNYKRLFNIVAAGASHLQLCLVEPFLDKVRAQAISFVNYGGYKLHPYPLEHLARLLMIKERDLEELCNECGLQISIGESGRRHLVLKQACFHPPKERKSWCKLLHSETI